MLENKTEDTIKNGQSLGTRHA